MDNKTNAPCDNAPPAVLVEEQWEISVSTMAGNSCSLQVQSSYLVLRVKELVYEAKTVDCDPYQFRLILGDTILEDDQTLHQLGVRDGDALSIVFGGWVPEWAKELGFEGDHPAFLRTYYADRDVKAPEWLKDNKSIWDALQQSMTDLKESRDQFKGWNTEIWLEKDGKRCPHIRSKPGTDLKFTVKGDIWNNNNDSCIHQCILALETTSLKGLYDGVPYRCKEIYDEVEFKAPEKEGVYMLYRYEDLMYGMADAESNFQSRLVDTGLGGKEQYPHKFVALLVVEA